MPWGYWNLPPSTLPNSQFECWEIWLFSRNNSPHLYLYSPLSFSVPRNSPFTCLTEGETCLICFPHHHVPSISNTNPLVGSCFSRASFVCWPKLGNSTKQSLNEVCVAQWVDTVTNMKSLRVSPYNPIRLSFLTIYPSSRKPETLHETLHNWRNLTWTSST